MTARVVLLDGLAVRPAGEGVAARPLPASIPGFIVAYLASQAGWVDRDELALRLWPDADERTLRHHLRVQLSRARALLPVAIETDQSRLRLSCSTDLQDFRQALGRGDWAAALGWARRPFADGLERAVGEEAGDWLRRERAAVDESCRQARLRDAARLEAQGRTAAAWDRLDEQLAREPADADALAALLRLARPLDRVGPARTRVAAARAADDAPLPANVEQALRALESGTTVSPSAPVLPPALVAPPMVGRAAERERIARARLALVAGEAGIGKTRLLQEAHPAALWIECRATLQNLPWQAVADAIDDRLERFQGLPALAERRVTLARVVPAIAGGEQLPPPGPDEDEAGIAGALAALLEQAGTAVVVDDLHWADRATRTFVEHLACRTQLRLCLAWRPQDADPALEAWLDDCNGLPGCERLDLAGLAAEDLADWIPGDRRPRQFAQWLRRHSGGNPFFAIETLRALFTSGQLTAGAQGWSTAIDKAGDDYRSLAVAPRVATLVQRRVLALDDVAQRLLGLTAVLGEAAPLPLLARLSGLTAPEAGAAIAAAQQAGLLSGRAFAHDLVRESLLAAMPEALRTAWHEAIANQGEEAIGPARCAGHAFAAGDAALGVACSLRAARAMRGRGQGDAAAALLGEALARCNGTEQQAALLAMRARLALDAGRTGQAAADAQAAHDGALDPAVRAAASVVLAGTALSALDFAAARRWLDRAEAGRAEEVELLLYSAYWAEAQGRLTDLLPALEAGVASRRALPLHADLAVLLTTLGAVHDRSGQGAEGEVCHREALVIAERLQARHVQVDVAANLVWSLSGRRAFDEAIAIGRTAMALGSYAGSLPLRANVAWCLAESGHCAEAAEIYEALIASGDPGVRCSSCGKLIGLRVQLQQPHEVRRAIAGALAAARGSESAVGRATALLGVLRHGTEADAVEALSLLRPGAFDTDLAANLLSAISARGLVPPFPIESL